MADSLSIEEREWRGQVGGMWAEIGRLQFDYLVEQGLKPNHRMLDVGCGCLRGGIHFIQYLNAGHYFGVDKNSYLLDAGRERELAAAGLRDRGARFLCTDSFHFSEFQTTFDYALAQSVFTHLPWNSILRCLVEMKAVLEPHGNFFATFFEDVDSAHKILPITHMPGEITTFPDKDPYHYEFSVFEDLACRAGLIVENMGCWRHPRAQRMMVFRHEAQSRDEQPL